MTTSTTQELTLDQALNLAVERHRQGDLATAESIYRQILAVAPNQADALHLLAVACRQQSRLEEALPLFEAAIRIEPNNPDSRANFGELLTVLGQGSKAEAQLRAALQLAPKHGQALNNLSLALAAQGKLEQAVAASRRAVEAQPQHANAHNNLGNHLFASKRAAEALQSFQQAQALAPEHADIALNVALAHEELGQDEAALNAASAALARHPQHAQLHSTVGRLLWQKAQTPAALEHLRQALNLGANDYATWNNYGLALHDSGEDSEALAAFRRAIAIDPDEAGAYSNMGITLKEQGAISDAIASFEAALARNPQHAQSWSNLGMALEIAGRAEEAVAAYRRALDCDPQLARAHSNLVFALNYLPRLDAADIAAEHRQWAARHVDADTPPPPPAVQTKERLRIGLVSPDLRQHPVSFLLLPYLEQRDRSASEIYVYADVRHPDQFTTRCQELSDHWRDIAGLGHEAVAAQIAADGIDLLVDLAGHSERHRLPVFARRPAPVQASWLGYFNTTGLPSIDYFVTDPLSTPPELAAHYSERPLYLPHSRFCYQAPPYAPAVAPLPAAGKGYVTFACFNNLAKLNDEVAAAWAQILQRVPASRLRLKALALNDAGVRAAWTARFAAHGIAADRLELRGHSPHAEMLAEYGEVDIALDPFPFCGGMTTCEALWMGVPVLTLAGQTLAGRQSHSLLHALDLPAWSCTSVDEYIERAVSHAGNPSALAELRQQLRPRFAASPAGDAPAYAAALDALWQQALRG